MRKFLFFFITVALLQVSCSNDDSNSPDSGNNVTLPKIIKLTDTDYPDASFTTTIKYIGNRIVSLTTEEKRTEFTYDENHIVKITTFDIRYDKNDKLSEQLYSYTDGKLAYSTNVESFTPEYPAGENISKSVYTYNPDGTVKREVYNIDKKTGEETRSQHFDLLTYQNGSLVKLVSTDTSVEPSTNNTTIYEYDQKNNPFKNILGFNLLLADEEYSPNNLIKHTSTDSVGGAPVINKIKYEYNENGYATKQNYYKTDGSTIGKITEYFY